jgi:hypothetical protein
MSSDISITATGLNKFVTWLLDNYNPGYNGGFVEKGFSPYSQGECPAELLKKFKALKTPS